MIGLRSVLRLAKSNTVANFQAVVFDGKSAIAGVPGHNFFAGVPCVQALSEPVVVPVQAIEKHLAKTSVLLVTPEGLTNGKGLVTPLGKPPESPMDELMMGAMPKQPGSDPVSWDLCLNSLDRVQIAAGRTDIRYYLNGVLMNLTTGAMVGTDGHRLHAYEDRVPMAFDRALKDGMPTKPEVSVICPNAPLDFIVRSKSPTARVSVWDADKEEQGPILFTTEDGFCWTRPIKGNYPDYQRVKPAVVQRPVWAEIDPVQLADAAEALGRVMALEQSKYSAVHFDFSQSMLTAVTKAGREQMPVDVVLHTDNPAVSLAALDELWAGFNASYVQDAADCVTSAAQWRLMHVNVWNESLLVVDGDFWGVLMPTRLGNEYVAPVAPVAVPQGSEVPETEPVGPVPAVVAAEVAAVLKNARKAPKKAPAKPKKAAVTV